MIAGFAAQDITPDPGLSMSGFSVRQGPPTAVGTHDPIYVHALAASENGSTVVLFAFDLIGLPVPWIEQVRAAVESECGVPAASQMYTCSHTHCGPGTGVIPYAMGDAPVVDPVYMECLAGSVVNVARAALANVAPANLRIGEGESYAGWNRRSAEAAPNGPCDGHVDDIDPAVVVAQFAGDHGAILGTVVNYGCHATSSRDSYYSSDYPGYVRSIVEAETGAPCIYVNGAGGDINPRGATTILRGFDLAERTGGRLGNDAVAVLDSMTAASSTTVGAATVDTEFVYRELISESEARRLYQEKAAEARAATSPEDEFDQFWRGTEYAKRVIAVLNDENWSDRLQVEVQVLRIGDLAIAASPSEFFSADGRSIRGDSPASYTMVAGWSNGNFGYTPTRRAVAHGGYEAESAFMIYGHPAAWDPISGDNIRAAAQTAISSLFD